MVEINLWVIIISFKFTDFLCYYNENSLSGRESTGEVLIKTHDSESRGQEETAIIRETKNTRPLSEGNPFTKLLTL